MYCETKKKDYNLLYYIADILKQQLSDNDSNYQDLYLKNKLIENEIDLEILEQYMTILSNIITKNSSLYDESSNVDHFVNKTL